MHIFYVYTHACLCMHFYMHAYLKTPVWQCPSCDSVKPGDAWRPERMVFKLKARRFDSKA